MFQVDKFTLRVYFSPQMRYWIPRTEEWKKGKVDVYRVATHITACVCQFVSAFGAKDHMTYFFLFLCSDLYKSLLFIGYFESMFFFVNHLSGCGRFGLIYQIQVLFSSFCATLAHTERKGELRPWNTNCHVNCSAHTISVQIITLCQLLVHFLGLTILSPCSTLVLPPLFPILAFLF